MPTGQGYPERADLVVTKIRSLLQRLDIQSKQIEMFREAFEEVSMQRDQLYTTVCELRMRDPEMELSAFKSTWPNARKHTAVEYHSKDGYECLPKNWISTPDTRKDLKIAEDAWATGKPQKALIELDQLIKKGLSEKGHVNALLLRSCIMRGSEELKQALGFATLAFRLAKSNGFHPLSGKSQYFRSLCFYEMQEFDDAKWSLYFAEGVRGYEDHIHMLHALLEEAFDKRNNHESQGKTPKISNHCLTSSNDNFLPVRECLFDQSEYTEEVSTSQTSNNVSSTTPTEVSSDCSCRQCPIHCSNLVPESQKEEQEEEQEDGHEEEQWEVEQEDEEVEVNVEEGEATAPMQVSESRANEARDGAELSPQSEAERSDHEEAPEVRFHSPTPPNSPKQDVYMMDVDREPPAGQRQLLTGSQQHSYLQVPVVIQSDHPHKDSATDQDPQISAEPNQASQASQPELKGFDHWVAEDLSYLDPVRSVENQYGIAENPSSPNQDYYGYLYRQKAEPKSRKSNK